MMLTMGEDGVGIGMTAPGVSGYSAEALSQPLVHRGEWVSDSTAVYIVHSTFPLAQQQWGYRAGEVLAYIIFISSCLNFMANKVDSLVTTDVHGGPVNHIHFF